MLRGLLSAVLTAAAAALAALIWRQQPLQVGSGERPLFLADPADVVLPWLAAVALVWLFPAAGGSRRRRVGFAVLVAAIAVGLAVALLLPRPPAQIGLGESAAGAAAERRTLVLAVDGLSWNRLLPLVRRGKLPHFARLMREGTSAVLHSHRTVRRSVEREGYWSPVVWTSIATGVAAPEHGITDFNLPGAAGGRTLAASYHRRVPAFWNLFSAFGRRVGVVGWWASWPAEEVEGVMASSGLGLRGRREGRGHALAEGIGERFDEGLTHPPELRGELDATVYSPGDTERFIDERLFPLSAYPVLGEGEANTFESVIWQDRYYYNIARHLLERERYAVFAVYFEGIDLVGHLFWRYADDPDAVMGQVLPDGFDEHARVVDRYYGVIDAYLGGLVELAGDDVTILVCSDHGFQSLPEHEKAADHSGYGVLLARGEGIRAGADLNLSLRSAVRRPVTKRVEVFDVLPTLLYLHGLPISDELDGEVLYRMIEPSYLRRHPRIRVPSYGDFDATRRVELEVPEEDREEYLERLRSLGYVD